MLKVLEDLNDSLTHEVNVHYFDLFFIFIRIFNTFKSKKNQ